MSSHQKDPRQTGWPRTEGNEEEGEEKAVGSRKEASLHPLSIKEGGETLMTSDAESSVQQVGHEDEKIGVRDRETSMTTTGEEEGSKLSGRKGGGADVLPRQRSSSPGPTSSYYVGPPSKNSAFGTAPVGVIGRDKPREIIR
ncbi:hypothetical protein IE53DRAFT_372306 [Violaceomyces palustris]|uniref:Uncharacterized protein n=1 Tax=Violaceomyces palustris TaxID=1673888 RepID=A0ACD0NL46_9BASI|nr:hypothetical protein IE53DRAFT_372306 [Violaceomyces palustris]